MCESCKKPFYITTPIYYPSSNLTSSRLLLHGGGLDGALQEADGL